MITANLKRAKMLLAGIGYVEDLVKNKRVPWDAANNFREEKTLDATKMLLKLKDIVPESGKVADLLIRKLGAKAKGWIMGAPFEFFEDLGLSLKSASVIGVYRIDDNKDKVKSLIRYFGPVGGSGENYLKIMRFEISNGFVLYGFDSTEGFQKRTPMVGDKMNSFSGKLFLSSFNDYKGLLTMNYNLFRERGF